jgi:plastocyanin
VTKPLSALVVTAILVAIPAACGSSGSNKSQAAPPVTQAPIVVVDMRGKKAVEVSAKDNFFDPNGIRIDPGTTVTWRNDGVVVHNVQPSSDLADFGGGKRFGVQVSGFGPGATYSYTFLKAGTFNYSCTIHTGMVGRVVVG